VASNGSYFVVAGGQQIAKIVNNSSKYNLPMIVDAGIAKIVNLT
jgi:hypothetical protein